MINELLKPSDKYIKFIDATDKHGRLEIIISVYDEPVMTTEAHNIFSTLYITEIKEDGERIAWGNLLSEDKRSSADARKAFKEIAKDPFMFKFK